jgi:hypothetical protein
MGVDADRGPMGPVDEVAVVDADLAVDAEQPDAAPTPTAASAAIIARRLSRSSDGLLVRWSTSLTVSTAR